MALGIKAEYLQDAEKLEKENSVLSQGLDILAAPVRGVEGAVQSVYNLADFATLDMLPDYDNRFLGKSETVAGGLVEGVTQFLVPYGGIAKGLTAASKIGRIGKGFTRVNKKGKEVLNWKGVLAAETATDFVAFDAQEERLSNLIQAFPQLSNPVTEFLEAREDDAELEGRFKNSLEGLGLTGLVGGMVVGLRGLRKNRRGEDGGQYLRENAGAFNQRLYGEVETYNAYSPSLRAVDQLKDESVFLHQVDKMLNKATGGMRGLSEELKWMGINNAETLKELADPSEIVKNKITKQGLRRIIQENALNLKIIEQSPNDYYNLIGTQVGGDNYREFTIEVAGEKQVEQMGKSSKEIKDIADTWTAHYENVAKSEGRANIAHFRTKDRYDEDGQRTLYVEELQSDYLQSTNKARRKAASKGLELEETLKPQPIEKSYIGSTIRAVLQMAATEGYDRVSWAKGQEIASLYDTNLSKLTLRNKNSNGSYAMTIEKNGEVTDKVFKNKEELESYFGKQASDDIDTWENGRTQEDYGVKVAPEPFIQQYDGQMPKAVDRFAKAFNSKTALKNVERSPENTIYDSFQPLIKTLGLPEQDFSTVDILDSFQTFAEDPRINTIDRRTKKEVSPEEAWHEAMKAWNDQQALNDPYWNRDNEEMGLDIEDPNALADMFEEVSQSSESDAEFYKPLFDIFFKRYEVRKGAGAKAPLESYSIDITPEMKESVSRGVSMWGVRTKANERLGTQIKDPELRAALGVDKVMRMSDLDVLRAERDPNAAPINDDNVTVKFALERLEANGSSPEVRRLAKSIRKLVGDDIEVNEASIRSYFGGEGAGAYIPEANQVELYTSRQGVMQGGDPDQIFGEGTLLHEIVHATVVTKIPPAVSASRTRVTGMNYLKQVEKVIADKNTSKPARKLLKAYRKAVENIPEEHANFLNHFNDPDTYADKYGKPTEEWYGFTNVDEFITEAMSNPQFQSFLKGIDSDADKSLFDEIMQVLKEFIGLDAEGTLLEDTVLAYSDLVSKHKKRYDPINYAVDAKQRMFPTRSSRAFQQRQQQRKSAQMNTLAGEIEVELDDIPRGGRIAITGVRNALDRAETTNDLGELLAAAEKKVEADLKASPKLKASSLEKGGIVQAVKRFSELTGTQTDLIDSEVKAAGKDANELRRIASRMYVVESMATDQADNVYTKAQEIAAKGTALTDADKADLVGSLKKMLHLVAAGSNLRRGFGQGLQSTQFKRTRVSLSEVELRSKEIVNEFMANNSEGNFEVLINRILLAGDASDVINRTLGIVKQARASDPKGFMTKAQNWYVNSLLSGPRTFMKNGIGNFIAQSLLQVEAAVGGVFVNKAITKQVLKEFATLESFREGMDFFLKAYKLDEQLLDTGRSPLENTARTERPLYFEGASPEETMKNAFNYFGENVVNIPTKLLLSMDEVFKQSLFRQNAKLELTLKGMKLGIKNPDELAEYVADGIDTVLVNGERAFNNSSMIKFANESVNKMDEEAVAKGGQRMLPSERGTKVQQIIEEQTQLRADKLKSVEEGGLGFENMAEIDNLSARSTEFARYGTFTNDAGKAAELAQAIVQTVPFMKFIFPFVRTPINILKFSFDRAFFAAPELSRNVLGRMPDLPMLKQTQEKMRLELESRNPVERARAIGKLSTSAMINATLLYMVYSNRDFITGGGPADISELKTLEQTGWQRYSFKLGNKYASFSGLDPIGAHMGVIVDLVEQLDNADELNTTVMERVFAAATVSMTRNLTDKSYLAGLQLLSDALSDPENKMEKMINNLGGGFVPNILYQGQSVAGDTTTREVRSLSDAILKKLPMGNARLDPKRNLLGEPIVAEQVPFVGPFNPSRMSTRDGDVVFEELAQLEHGFSNPRAKLDRVINLDEYINDKGQTAHDRRLELIGTTRIRGRTLRQSLERLIKSAKYRRLSTFSEGGFKSPRVDLLNRVMAEYRAAALEKTLREFPEVNEKHKRVKRAKSLSKLGAGENALSQLLDFQ